MTPEREAEAWRLIEGYRDYMEDNGYSSTLCDCDPSVGINTCDYCDARAWLAAEEREDDSPSG